MTAQEWNKGLIVSIGVGLYYLANAFWPITIWFVWVKNEFNKTTTNSAYKAAWLALVYGHLIVFSPMALLWPFTYIGSGVVVEFWDLSNWWLGTLTASAIFLVISIMWIIAATQYETTSVFNKRAMWLELIIYVLVEALSWYATIYNYPIAHNWFYYAYTERTEDDAKIGKVEVDINGNDLDDGDEMSLQPIDF